MILLETDHASILKYRDAERCLRLLARMAVVFDDVIGTTIITVEDQRRGGPRSLAGCDVDSVRGWRAENGPSDRLDERARRVPDHEALHARLRAFDHVPRTRHRPPSLVLRPRPTTDADPQRRRPDPRTHRINRLMIRSAIRPIRCHGWALFCLALAAVCARADLPSPRLGSTASRHSAQQRVRRLKSRFSVRTSTTPKR